MVSIDRTRTYSYTDQSKDYNKCRGSFKNGVFNIWISHIPKSEFSFNLTVSEIDAMLSKHGNSNYAIYQLPTPFRGVGLQQSSGSGLSHCTFFSFASSLLALSRT